MGYQIAVWPFFGLQKADLNALDFYFWIAAEKAVNNVKPKDIKDLQRTVEALQD